MESPDWSPRISIPPYQVIDVPVLSEGDDGKLDCKLGGYYYRGGAASLRLDYQSGTFFIDDTNTIDMKLIEGSKLRFASLSLFAHGFNGGASNQDPINGVFTVELVNRRAVETQSIDTSKNLCLESILQFSNDKPEHMFANCFDLDKLETEGFLFPGDPSLFLCVRVHVCYLRKNIGPGIYLDKVGRSYMLHCYTYQVLKRLKDICRGLLTPLGQGLGNYNGLQGTEKNRIKETYLGPVDVDTILSSITAEYFSQPTWILYPLIMELLHYGAVCADEHAGKNYQAFKFRQLIRVDGKTNKLYLMQGTLGKKMPLMQGTSEGTFEGTFGKSMPTKLKGYTTWLENMSENVPHMDVGSMVDECLASGWCIVQLYTMHHYFSLVRNATEVGKPEKKKKKKKKKTVVVEQITERADEDDDKVTKMVVPAQSVVSFSAPEELKQDDIEVQKTITVNGVPDMVTWIGPSRKGVTRVDCDGAFGGLCQSGGYGSIAREIDDETEQVVVLGAIAGSSTPASPLVHEFEGALSGWTLCSKLHRRNIEVACDSVPTIWQILKGLVVSRKIGKDGKRSCRMKDIINNILKIDSTMESSVIFHMYRGANEVANFLAHLRPALRMEYKRADFGTRAELLPVLHFLDSDANQRPYPKDGI